MVNQKKNLARLLREAQKGDEDSLQKLCVEIDSIMRDYFQMKFHDPSLIDDLSQETQLRMLKNLSSIKEPMKIKNFVLKVSFHVVQDYFRQKYRRQEDELIEEAYSNDQDRNSETILNNLDLERAMGNLPEKTQQILRLKADGFKYEEISEVVNISVSGVKMQVKRGLEKLKNSLFIVTFFASKTIILMSKYLT
jgi:RNA polymerase sigma-70 factor (ECF subfamily)